MGSQELSAARVARDCGYGSVHATRILDLTKSGVVDRQVPFAFISIVVVASLASSFAVGPVASEGGMCGPGGAARCCCKMLPSV